MDIRKRKLKGYIALSILIIVCMLLASAMTFFTSNNNAEAIEIENGFISVLNGRDLLEANYETNNNGSIFDRKVLYEIYSKLSGENSTYANIESDSKLKKAGTEQGEIHSGLDSDDIRKRNDGNNLVVTFGNMQWTVVSLTTDINENPILTLWLTDIAFYSKYNNWGDGNYNYNYPSTMYSSSYIRARLLNGVGSNGQNIKYVANKGDTVLSLLEESDKVTGYPFNAFTLNSTVNSDDSVNRSNGSITDFLVKPKDVPYQLTESMADFDKAKVGNGWKQGQNDALSKISVDKWANSSVSTIQDKSGLDGQGYYDWGNDYIWLPSWVEIGYGTPSGQTFYSGSGLWNTNKALRSSSGVSATRTGDSNGAQGYNYCITKNGENLAEFTGVNNVGVRPAIHLNLKAVDDASAANVPNSGTNSNTTKFIDNGSDVTFTLYDVNSNTLDITITATDRNGVDIAYSKTPSVSGGVLSFTASTAGTYTVKVTPKDGKIWTDGTSETKTFSYLLKEPVTPLTWKTSGEEKATKTYNGKTQYIELENYDESEMNVSPAPVKIPDGEPNSGKWGIAVKDFADSSITVDLKDSNFAGWSDSNAYDAESAEKKSLYYKVNAKSLTATASGAWSAQVNTESTTYDVYIDVFDSDIGSIEFEGYYKKDGGTEKKTVSPTVVKDGDNRAKVTVTLPNSLETGVYEYILKLKSGTMASKNYTLSFSKTFTVESKKLTITEDDIIWQYTNSKVGAGYHTVSELDSDGIFNVDYNGSVFTFDVDTDTLSKDAEYKVEGEKSATIVKLNGTAVEYYTATLKITPKDGVEIENKEFTLKWRINKAKFDLSEVKWNYSKPKLFNDKEQEVVMTGIPDGLTFNYKNNKKRPVGTYTAEVLTITVRNDMKNNYITPEVGNTTTYKGSVAWTLPWKIKRAELELDWTPKEEKDVNDKSYLSWESTTYTDKIEYRYYTLEAYADGALTGEPIDKRNIIVPDEEVEIEYYIVAVVRDATNYEIVGTWSMPFVVGSLATIINVNMASEFTYDKNQHGSEWYNTSIAGMEYVSAEYFKVEEDGSETSLGSTAPTDVGSYIVRLSVDREYLTSYQLSKAKVLYTIVKAQIEIAVNKNEYGYDGLGHAGEIAITSGNYDVSKIIMTYYKGNTKDYPLSAGELPCDAGDYLVVLSLPSADSGNYEIKEGCKEFIINVAKKRIVVEWNTTGDTPIISGLDELSKGVIGYVYYNEDGTPLEDGAQLERGKSYKIKAILTGDNARNFEFVTKDGEPTPSDSTETEEIDFTVKASNSGGNVGGVTGGDGQDPTNPDDPEKPATSFDFSKIGEYVKEYWQLIASVISIILMLVFISKTIGYENKRKQNKKTIEKKYSTFYGITLFGLTTMTWNLIAGVLMGGALVTFIIMLVAKSKYKKSNVEVEDAKDEFERNQKDFDNRRRVDENQHRDEQLQMMLMGMMGGNANSGGGGAQQGFAYAQPMIGLGADDIRGIVAETMNNMLPNVTQYLPQQASTNDELVQQLVEQNAQNEERIRQLTEQNEEKIRQLTENNERAIERLVEKLSKQQTVEVAEKEVASSVITEDALKELKDSINEIKNQMNATTEKTAQSNSNDDIIKSLIEGQKTIMEKLVDKPTEKVVEREVSRKDSNDDRILKVVSQSDNYDETIRQLLRNQEMMMRQIVDLSSKTNEKVIVEKPVEKIVEKEVKVEVPVEKIVEVEKVVEKVVPMSVEKPAKATKTPAPRLTLDEAYAKLTASQKKIFDTLKAYAMSKDKCKEKKSTYFTVLGQSTVNPLVKLTIKKNT
ncbi:MAG: hypothetical protein HDT29_07455, partial [Clostridiales bacterium]|nr:hypothetical protein [Clostridiales bacterium]